MPAHKRYWPELLAKRYNTVKEAQLEEVIIVARGQGGRKRLGPQQDMMPGGMMLGREMTPEMMMMMGGRGGVMPTEPIQRR